MFVPDVLCCFASQREAAYRGSGEGITWKRWKKQRTPYYSGSPRRSVQLKKLLLYEDERDDLPVRCGQELKYLDSAITDSIVLLQWASIWISPAGHDLLQGIIHRG